VAANFRILRHMTSQSLHLRLEGDFDGTSAHELLNCVTHRRNPSRIFIHTAGLRKINPFGSDLFRSRMGFFKQALPQLVFTGVWAGTLAPAECRIKA